MTNSNDVEKVLNLVRQLVNLVKDESLSDDQADREVAKILVNLDIVMAKIDGGDDAPKGNQLTSRMQIDAPKKKPAAKKKAK